MYVSVVSITVSHSEIDCISSVERVPFLQAVIFYKQHFHTIKWVRYWFVVTLRYLEALTLVF